MLRFFLLLIMKAGVLESFMGKSVVEKDDLMLSTCCYFHNDDDAEVLM